MDRTQKEQASPATSTNGESEVDGIDPGRVRAFAIFMLVGGAIVAVLPLFGLTLRRFADAPPIVVTCAGLAVFVIGAVALAFSFNKHSAQAGVQTAKIVLWTIIALFVLVPIVAVIATLLGY